jgi:hypothetical protein
LNIELVGKYLTLRKVWEVVLPRYLLAAIALVSTTAVAHADPLTSNRNIDIRVANDAGALYGSGPSDTYFINAPGGGLNQLHITTDGSAAGVAGQVTSLSTVPGSTSGGFFVSTTGGRGYNDDIILGISLQGPISDSFSISVRSSGYQWTASSAGVVNPLYNASALNETFNTADFIYGPNTAKPGPGSGFVLPFYSGQNINDPATAQMLMFVDLNVGNTNLRSQIDSGNAKVEFDVSGLLAGDILSFNAYAWAFSANVADSSINWTNNLSTNPDAPGQSGFSISAVPEPSTWAMVILGFIVIGATVYRRGKATALAA